MNTTAASSFWHLEFCAIAWIIVSILMDPPLSFF
jgi:hypothetical protein